jgi:hypothetical protein
MTTATRNLRYFLASAISVVAVAVVVLSGTILAADNMSFQISPPVTTLAVDPGNGVTGKIKVTNLTDTQISLQVGKTNFVAKGEEGQVELLDEGNPAYSLAPYFTLDQSTLDVPPRGSKDVAYSINVPNNAEPGGRYGSVTFNTIPAKLPNGQSGASVKQELAALIFLRINGATNEQLSIESFTTGSSFYEFGPIGFTTRIKNLGTVHERPTGEIVVKDLLGFTAGKVKLEEKNIIPGAIRKFESELNKKFLFGYYTATLTVQNGSVQTLTDKTSFTVIPYRILAIVVAILVILFLVFWKGRKRISRAIRILSGKE